MELDHIFILCDTGAPEAELLREHGFIEGPPNTHPGQGTSSRRFFFINFYLELLFVHDAAEAQNDFTRPTFIYQRWLNRATACPFGIVWKADMPPQFPSFAYRPPYLPDDITLYMGANAGDMDSPLLACLTSRVNLSSRGPIARNSQMLHSVQMHGPRPAAAVTEPIQWVTDSEFLLELSFRGGGAGTLDLRPKLPLILRD